MEEIQQTNKDTIQLSKSTVWQIISGLLFVLLVVSIFTSGFGFDSGSPTGGTVVDNNQQGNNNVPTGVADVSADDDAFLGDKNAPVTIIEFSDFQCPFCRKFWTETFEQLKTQYIDTGKVKLVYRDFPLASINLHKHPLQKNKYRVWPLMNLSVTADDIEMKISHIIRGKDHADNAKRQEMIYKVLGLEKKFPWTFFMGKIKFTDIALSKRKLNLAIKEGKYSGAEDVRLPTISSLKKRGYKPEAFEKFAEQRGLTDVDKLISQKDFFKIIDTFNKD